MVRLLGVVTEARLMRLLGVFTEARLMRLVGVVTEARLARTDAVARVCRFCHDPSLPTAEWELMAWQAFLVQCPSITGAGIEGFYATVTFANAMFHVGTTIRPPSTTIPKVISSFLHGPQVYTGVRQ